MGKINEQFRVTNTSDEPWRFIWIVDFPLFEMESDSIQSVHHPFTQPQIEITSSNLLEVSIISIVALNIMKYFSMSTN